MEALLTSYVGRSQRRESQHTMTEINSPSFEEQTDDEYTDAVNRAHDELQAPVQQAVNDVAEEVMCICEENEEIGLDAVGDALFPIPGTDSPDFERAVIQRVEELTN